MRTAPNVLLLASVASLACPDGLSDWLHRMSAPRTVYKPLIVLLESSTVEVVVASLALLAR